MFELSWVKSKRLSSRITLVREPHCPQRDDWKYFIYVLVEDPRFEIFIMGLIVLNTVFMAAEYYGILINMGTVLVRAKRVRMQDTYNFL